MSLRCSRTLKDFHQRAFSPGDPCPGGDPAVGVSMGGSADEPPPGLAGTGMPRAAPGVNHMRTGPELLPSQLLAPLCADDWARSWEAQVSRDVEALAS